MPKLVLPFAPREPCRRGEGLLGCGIYPLLPKTLKEVSKEHLFLLEYINSLPIEEIGIPRYYEKLSRRLGDLKNPNLIYPVSEGIFIHIYPETRGERHWYISVEPILNQNLDSIMAQIEERLLDFTDNFAGGESEEERKQTLLKCVDLICEVKDGNGNGNGFRRRWFRRNGRERIRLKRSELEAVKYLLVRDKIGLGILEPMIRDSYIEDISCSGMGHIFVEHKIFHSLKTAISFATYDELDEFVQRLAERIKRPVTLHNPIVDGSLPDGSRINIVFGKDVSKRGSNFTIRKFSETPLSILELIEFGTMNYAMAAYLSLVIEEGMNVFVVGETASGKTTTLNALTTFIPPESKIVSIEDTPELQVPHKNWVREVAREKKAGERAAEVGMFDLLKAALRQRPNVILVGEIRGREGNIAFQAMQTGHGVMSTFHAASVEKLIQRLTGDPINVPRAYIDNLNVVIIQSAVKLPNGKIGRRVLSISEIVGYDPQSQSFSFVEVFHWDPARDKFDFVGNLNSYLLEQKIAPKRGIPPERKRQIYGELKRRARILERLHKEKGVRNFYELLQILAAARRQGVF